MFLHSLGQQSIVNIRVVDNVFVEWNLGDSNRKLANLSLQSGDNNSRPAGNDSEKLGNCACSSDHSPHPTIPISLKIV